MRHTCTPVSATMGAVRLSWPACECGWRSRLPRLTAWTAARAHAIHALAAAGGHLDALYLPEPERYEVTWKVRVDELWIPARQLFADADCAARYAYLLDNLPASVRDVRLTDTRSRPCR